jgi:hypothetical protein
MPPKKKLPSTIKVKIPDELVITEKKRCGEFNGNEDKCKSNNCFYRRKSKKCDIHYNIVAENMKSKKESRRYSSKSVKKSKRRNKSDTNNSRKKSKKRNKSKRNKSKRKSRR